MLRESLTGTHGGNVVVETVTILGKVEMVTRHSEGSVNHCRSLKMGDRRDQAARIGHDSP